LALVASIATAIATTGEFRQRWQANRIAAAELERLGYDLLASESPDIDSAFKALGEIQFRRAEQITGIKNAGTSERREPPPVPANASAPPAPAGR
jgi:hypothetical protein